MVWTPPKSWATGDVETAGVWNTYVRDQFKATIPGTVSAVSWTPELVTSGAADPVPNHKEGRYWRVGPLVFVWARFNFGISTDAGSGVYRSTLPITAARITALSTSGSGTSVGSWQSRDNSTLANSAGGTVTLRDSTSVLFSLPVGGVVTNSTPFSWSSDDVLSFHAIYPVA